MTLDVIGAMPVEVYAEFIRALTDKIERETRGF